MAENYEDFLGRIDGFVTWVDTAIANMRVGMERGITHPREAMLKVVPQLDPHIVDDPRASLFYEPIRNFPPAFDEDTRRALEGAYLTAIQNKIVRAYRRLRAFMQDEYLPRCRTSAGLSDLPAGDVRLRGPHVDDDHADARRDLCDRCPRGGPDPG